MLVYPLDPRPLELTGHYPHLAPRDVQVWEEFVRQQSGNFRAVAYDAALGGQVITREGVSAGDALGWRYSTAMHVDAVLWMEGMMLAVEVKPHAGASAIGQALCYATLLELDPTVLLPVMPCVVTDYASADVRLCAEQLGVLLIEISAVVPAGGAAAPSDGPTAGAGV